MFGLGFSSVNPFSKGSKPRLACEGGERAGLVPLRHVSRAPEHGGAQLTNHTSNLHRRKIKLREVEYITKIIQLASCKLRTQPPSFFSPSQAILSETWEI